MWNCCNLEETNLTRRLNRQGLNNSSSRIKIKGPSKGRNQVMEGKALSTAYQKMSAVGFPFVKS